MKKKCYLIETLLPKRSGRPPDAAIEGRILAAAGHLMLAQGFSGTTMDDIAAEAQISKITLYRRFPDKRSLLKRVVETKCRTFLPNDTFLVPSASSPTKALEHIGIQLLSLISDAEAINLVRMLVTEGPKMPEVVDDFFAAGPRPVKAKMAELLEEFRKQGKLKFDSAEDTREMFYGLIVGRYLHDILVQPDFKLSQKDIKQHVQKAVIVFMRAHQ
jgi:TetR/AcrR family transcriptional regulator, mexJK operon transcriptional repressor